MQKAGRRALHWARCQCHRHRRRSLQPACVQPPLTHHLADYVHLSPTHSPARRVLLAVWQGHQGAVVAQQEERQVQALCLPRVLQPRGAFEEVDFTRGLSKRECGAGRAACRGGLQAKSWTAAYSSTRCHPLSHTTHTCFLRTAGGPYCQRCHGWLHAVHPEADFAGAGGGRGAR